MPTKTKRVKIRAELRRTDYRFISPKVSPTPTQSPQHITHITTIRSDLAKTIVLATIAITVEIGLYFVLR